MPKIILHTFDFFFVGSLIGNVLRYESKHFDDISLGTRNVINDCVPNKWIVYEVGENFALFFLSSMCGLRMGAFI